VETSVLVAFFCVLGKQPGIIADHLLNYLNIPFIFPFEIEINSAACLPLERKDDYTKVV
jgi:hypothetical protein